MATDVYKELVFDLYGNTDTDWAQASNIVDWLKDEGLLDYDTLKEYYENAE